MNEIQSVPTNRLFAITFVTAILAMILFSQVISDPTEQRQISDLSDPTPSTVAEEVNGSPSYGDQEINVASQKDTWMYYFLVSASSVFTAALVGIVTIFAFVYYFNVAEIRQFVNNAFEINGMESNFGQYGKTGGFSLDGDKFPSSIHIYGFKKLRAKFILPYSDKVDPREFGLREEHNIVTTICDLELVPLKLRVISEYFKEL